MIPVFGGRTLKPNAELTDAGTWMTKSSLVNMTFESSLPAQIPHSHTPDYYPPVCILDKIINPTVAASDPFDGQPDGVIAQSELCKLDFDMKSLIGSSQSDSVPAQTGTVIAEDVEVAQAVHNCLHNSQDQWAHLSWQIGSAMSDADPSYNNATGGQDTAAPTWGPYLEDNMQTMIDWVENGVGGSTPWFPRASTPARSRALPVAYAAALGGRRRMVARLLAV
ncbi:hypothetical protein F5Y01DRAFT_320644 [Xylaria sp. FL0043]|nr:hypothetical protein F5Y01DRAFT_320644 [Xylaria sp. FL0043]